MTVCGFAVRTLLPLMLASPIWPGSVAAQRVDPPNRVIYLHYDYMVKDGVGAHSHEPDPRAIEMVVEAFRRQGITLHIDPVHNAIPERRVVTSPPFINPACNGSDAATLEELRATYFPKPHGKHTWHYALFGHRAICPNGAHCAVCGKDEFGGTPDPTSTGYAELPGVNFAVTFGPYIDAGVSIPLALEASTFMHELGHNLGLLHGGENNVNWKPNYISIMNFAYQLNGILFADSPHSSAYKTCTTDWDCGRGAACEPRHTIKYCFRVDYSDRELPALNEERLDESAGVSGQPDDRDLVFYFAPPTVQLLGRSYGPIDWNNDGDSYGLNVSADINNDTSLTLLQGFNDWAYLHEYLNTPEYRNGIVRHDRRIVTHGPRR